MINIVIAGEFLKQNFPAITMFPIKANCLTSVFNKKGRAVDLPRSPFFIFERMWLCDCLNFHCCALYYEHYENTVTFKSAQ